MIRTEKLLIFCLSMLIVVSGFAQREYVLLNQQWNFKGASLWEDSVEELVDIPHSWNTKDAAQGYKYYRGVGQYKKMYFVDESLAGKRLFLKFDGAQTVADVYLNGQHLGQHRGGYSAFVFEITNVVKYGEENLIEVKVDNSKTEDVLPLGGDFNIYGGMYRPVHLLITDKVCITPLDFASPGVYLIQKNISREKAEIEVVTKISNGKQTAETVEVEVAISDAEGKIVKTGKVTVLVDANATGQATVPVNIENPHLWNGLKDPYLYLAKISVKVNAKTVDELIQPLGLRYYHTDSEKGFFLNDEHVKVKGVSRHNDFAGVASALQEKHHKTDVELIKEMGANGIRLAHYQHAEYFYSLCDTSGLMVWAEIPFVGSDVKGYNDTKEFRANAKQQLQELVRQNYNHPAILFWGLYNEIGMKSDSTLFQIVQDLYDLAKTEDPTRQTVAASFITKSGNALNKIPDMIAWNQYYGWYYGKPDRLAVFLDKMHSEQPEYKIGISEYGAGGSAWQHGEKIRRPFPFYHPWHPEEFQTTVHEGNWKAIAERDFVWGSFVWNMFDFGSHFRREGDAIGMNDKGMVSYDRKIKKDAFYFYKANWSGDPVIHITNSRYAIREKDKINVKVYSNLDNVKLIVNGESLGTVDGEYSSFNWQNVLLNKGNNRVVATGEKDGKTYTDSVVWMYDKSSGYMFAITFIRWLIKPFVLVVFLLVVWFVWLLLKRRVKSWRKVLVILLLVLFVLILLAITIAQIYGSKNGINLFEYSLI